MKKIVLAFALAGIAALGINATLVEKDPLHGLKFDVTQTEYKDGAPKTTGKPLVDLIDFKSGKVYSDVAADKLKFDQWIKYNIEKDSTYSEGDEEKHYYEIKASKENDDGMVLEIFMKIDDIDIEGSMKLLKSDKLKKHYEFAGKQQASKKKGK